MRIAAGLRAFLAAVGIALFVAAAPALARDTGAPDDAPALWKIETAKGRVFLFGSFHLLPPDVKWRTPAVESALKEAEVVVFETDLEMMQNPQVMQASILKYGLLPQGQTLRYVLPGDTHAEFERRAADLRLPPANLAPFRPWLAAMTLSVGFMVTRGLDPNSGVEKQALAWAKAHGKALGSLETTEDQLRVFADLTREQEVQFLGMTLRQIREMPNMLADMLGAYRTGDVAALDRTLNIGLREFPLLRQRLLKDRHEKWLPRIEKMIVDGRTHVIIVGAAHLVGPDSVIAMLRAKGVKVDGP